VARFDKRRGLANGVGSTGVGVTTREKDGFRGFTRTPWLGLLLTAFWRLTPNILNAFLPS
jgi:hypothetical protein